jgi:hypothetical protein
LTIEELTGRFKAVVDEEEMAGESFPDGGKLYYATEHCQCHVCRKKGEPPDRRKRGKPCRCPRRVVALRAMHEEVPRRPTLRRAATTAATSATTVGGVATFLGSATSRGGAGLRDGPRRGQAHEEPRRVQAHDGPRRGQALVAQVGEEDEEVALF